MIEHVVLIRPGGEPNLTEHILKSFRSFQGGIPGVIRSVAGEDFSGRCQPFSLMAIVCLESREALEMYQRHPAHQTLVELLNSTGSERIAADIEVEG